MQPQTLGEAFGRVDGHHGGTPPVQRAPQRQRGGGRGLAHAAAPDTNENAMRSDHRGKIRHRLLLLYRKALGEEGALNAVSPLSTAGVFFTPSSL